MVSVLGHFGHGCFGPDILARNISATHNAKGGRFGHNNKLWVGDRCMHVRIHACVMHLVNNYLLVR